jgi:hypothetical protein
MQDDYRFNVLLTPGLFASTANLGASQVTSIINNTQNRGDNIYVVDLVPFGSSITTKLLKQMLKILHTLLLTGLGSNN